MMNVSKNNFRDDFEKIVSLLILMINSKIIQTSLMKIQMSPMILIINQTNNSHLETHKDVKEDVTKLLIKTENLVIKILIQMLMVHLMIDTMKTLSMSYNTINKKIIQITSQYIRMINFLLKKTLIMMLHVEIIVMKHQIENMIKTMIMVV